MLNRIKNKIEKWIRGIVDKALNDRKMVVAVDHRIHNESEVIVCVYDRHTGLIEVISDWKTSIQELKFLDRQIRGLAKRHNSVLLGVTHDCTYGERIEL